MEIENPKDYGKEDFENRIYISKEALTHRQLENIHHILPKIYRKIPLDVIAYQIKDVKFIIENKEGITIGEPGDYLVLGAEGEYYLSKKNVFEATYLEIPEKTYAYNLKNKKNAD